MEDHRAGVQEKGSNGSDESRLSWEMSILRKNCQALITQDGQKSPVILHIENDAWENSAAAQMTMAEGGPGS